MSQTVDDEPGPVPEVAWVEVRIHPVYGPQVSNWPDEPIPPGRYVKAEP